MTFLSYFSQLRLWQEHEQVLGGEQRMTAGASLKLLPQAAASRRPIRAEYGRPSANQRPGSSRGPRRRPFPGNVSSARRGSFSREQDPDQDGHDKYFLWVEFYFSKVLQIIQKINRKVW